MKTILKIILLIVLTISALPVWAQSSSAQEKWTTKKAEKWFKQKDWLNGWTVEPDKTINIQEFAWQYHQNQKYWDEAFAFLKSHDLKTLAKGKYPIDSNFVYATVTEDPSKDMDKTGWESHRKYVDLQYVIDGEEKIGVFPVAKAQVIKEYDETKDVANYAADGPLQTASPTVFFLFFPTDAHRPNITPGGNKVVKKIVIKIRAAE
jgi:YhcH/YjgK/YiaL family protein